MCDVLFASEGVPPFTTLSLARYPAVGGVSYDGVVTPATVVLVSQFQLVVRGFLSATLYLHVHITSYVRLDSINFAISNNSAK